MKKYTRGLDKGLLEKEGRDKDGSENSRKYDWESVLLFRPLKEDFEKINEEQYIETGLQN